MKTAFTSILSSHVLVLDAELQRTSKFCSRTELATRILCSGWMRRLWTLQEAVVTQYYPNCSKFGIQFLEGPLEFDSLMKPMVLSFYYSESAVIAVYSSIPQLRKEVDVFGFLARALEYRMTSKPEDEAICLASILGIRLDEIASLTTAEERMRVLYSLIKQLPSSILCHRGSRLQLDGVRWPPASLLNNHRFFLCASDSAPATCDAQGLYVKIFGYVVLYVEAIEGPVIYMKESGETQPSALISPLPITSLYFSTDQMANDPFSLVKVTKIHKIIREETEKLGIIINPEGLKEDKLCQVLDQKRANPILIGRNT